MLGEPLRGRATRCAPISASIPLVSARCACCALALAGCRPLGRHVHRGADAGPTAQGGRASPNESSLLCLSKCATRRSEPATATGPDDSTTQTRRQSCTTSSTSRPKPTPTPRSLARTRRCSAQPPKRGEFDPRDIWDRDEGTAALSEAFRILAEGVAPDSFQLADKRESLLSGIVNAFDAPLRAGLWRLARACR